jgi:hypothetical protein
MSGRNLVLYSDRPVVPHVCFNGYPVIHRILHENRGEPPRPTLELPTVTQLARGVFDN